MEIITFEEYKKQMENYSAIDTPAKLESVKMGYESYIKRREDAKYLEPVTSSLEEHLDHEKYATSLKKIFKWQEMDKGEIRIIVIPAFEPEYQVRILGNEININRLNANRWAEIYTGNHSNGAIVQSKAYKRELNTDKQLPTDMIVAIEGARMPKGEGWVLDGVKYLFLYNSANGVKIAQKHSPDEETETGALIARLEKMVEELEKDGGES